MFDKHGSVVSGNGLHVVVEKRAGISIVSIKNLPLKTDTHWQLPDSSSSPIPHPFFPSD